MEADTSRDTSIKGAVADDAAFPVSARFEIHLRRYLDENGEPVAPLPPMLADPAALLPLYRGMSLARALDAKCVALNRTGRLGTYATALGQEAVPIGVASAMQATDVLVPSYREGSAMLWRGVKLSEFLLYFVGDERGSGWSGPREDFPISITVGGHALHAVGVATAFRIRGQERAVVCVFGDAATSKGDVYESMNLAGVWRLPVVFVITNNRWAISTPLHAQTAASTLAQKGVAGGIHCEQVDGNDVLAVHQAVKEALARARAGGGAALIEALTYRLNHHNTADDSARYRDPAEVDARWPFEPLLRLRRYLEAGGAWSDADEERLQAELSAEIDEAVGRALQVAPEDPAVMFEHLYERLPAALESQRAAAARNADSAGGP